MTDTVAVAFKACIRQEINTIGLAEVSIHLCIFIVSGKDRVGFFFTFGQARLMFAFFFLVHVENSQIENS